MALWNQYNHNTGTVRTQKRFPGNRWAGRENQIRTRVPSRRPRGPGSWAQSWTWWAPRAPWWSRAPMQGGFGLGSLTSPHCVSCTVIHGRVLRCRAAQWEGDLALGGVPGDAEPGFQGWVVVCASTTTYSTNPLQRLPWSLADPAYTTAA